MRFNKFKLINKSVIIACTISVLVPIFLFLLENVALRILELYMDKMSRDTFVGIYNNILILQGPIFLEYNLLAVSFVWIVFRFIILVIFAYLNGKLLEKNKIIIKNKNRYLIITSIIIYFITLPISLFIFLFLDSIDFIHEFFKFFKFFSI